MTRIYAIPGAWVRNSVSLAILVAVALYGVWELWGAANGPADQQAISYAFGVAFVGGAAYGLWQTIADTADKVMTFDRDEASGRTLATLWRPFWTEKLVADLTAIGNWRFFVAIGNRNARTFFVLADHPGYPRPLKFELRPGIVEGLRKVAPEAIADFEKSMPRKAG